MDKEVWKWGDVEVVGIMGLSVDKKTYKRCESANMRRCVRKRSESAKCGIDVSQDDEGLRSAI
jgi:hypothetical protein